MFKKGLLAIGLIFSTTTLAESESTSNSLGKDLYQSCATCHGSNGISDNDYIPNLACQKSGYLARQIYNFKSWQRVHSVMREQIKNLSTGHINSLVEYISQLECSEDYFDLKSQCAEATQNRQTCITCCFGFENVSEINKCTSSCEDTHGWQFRPLLNKQ